MQVRAVFYGRLKTDTGTATCDLRLDGESITVQDVVDALVALYPALEPQLPTVAFAIGAALVGRDAAVQDGDEVGLLPPVSGG